MRRLSMLGSTSIHKTDVFKTLLDDNDSWSASLGGGSSGGGFVKPQIERIGDNDEEWFSEAEQRVSEEDSNHSKSPVVQRKQKQQQPQQPQQQRRQGSGKGKKLLLPARQPSREDDFLDSQFKLSDVEKEPSSRRDNSSKKKTLESPKRSTVVGDGVAATSCLQFDFAKAKAMPGVTAVPMDAFLSEFETTENEHSDLDELKRSHHRDRKKKVSKDDPKRKQRRSERARKMEEDFSESESDFDTTPGTARVRTSRKTSMLGELTDEELDVLGHTESEKTVSRSVSRSASLRQPSQKRSSSSKKPSVRRSASEAVVKPNTESRSSRTKSVVVNEKAEKKKEISRLAPAKKDCQSDASILRSRTRRPTSPTSLVNHRQKDRGDESDGTDDSDSRQRGAIPAQYQVKNNNGLNAGKQPKSPSKEKRRQSMAPTKPEDVVDAIRRRYSISSAAYNTDTETDDQSVMTDSSEVSRRSHRRSRDIWREKEKFKQQADTKFGTLSPEQKNLSEKEMMRQLILDQSRRGAVQSLSRRSMQDAERSDSTRLLGQLLGEPDENSASDHEKTERIRRQSLEVGYGQDSVYGSIDQLEKRNSESSSSYLPSGLNQAGRRAGHSCDRRGSQTGGDSGTDSMRNLMQTLEGATKVVDSKNKMMKKKGKFTSPNKSKEQSGASKEQGGAASYDKSIDEILKARRLRGAKGRQKANPDKTEETKKFNAMNLLTAGMLFK